MSSIVLAPKYRRTGQNQKRIKRLAHFGYVPPDFFRVQKESGPISATHPAARSGKLNLSPFCRPLILEDLRKQPFHWFWALNAITGEDPIPQSMRGRVREIAGDWITWGVKKKLIEANESGQ